MTRDSFAPIVVGAVLCLASMVGPTPADAEALLFDWGGSEKPNDSGKMTVRFDMAARPGDVIVSFGDRKVYFITRPGEALSYPIAIPREQSRWQGITAVTQKRQNPSWTPTPTMRAENAKLPAWVPGGHPMNPLGTHALYLGSSAYRIHGTDAPWSVGSAVSKGCVRMFNKDVQDLYPRVKVGAKVTVTWQTFKPTPKDGAEPSDAIEAAADKSQPPASNGAAAANVQTSLQHEGIKPLPNGDRGVRSVAKEPKIAAVKASDRNRSEPDSQPVAAPAPLVDSSRKEPAVVKPTATVVTGSLHRNRNTPPAATEATEVAKSALAAAERAAAAAERAAAAAERAVAAVEQRSSGVQILPPQPPF